MTEDHLATPHRTRYQPLVEHLAAHAAAEIVLTFAEIEAIIGGSLPMTACLDTSYWGSGRMAHAQALRAVGWRGQIDRYHGAVRFTRDLPVKHHDEPRGGGGAVVRTGGAMARRSVYQPLIDYLAAHTEAEVILTFPEIEAMLGRTLPTAAYTESSYWTAKQIAHGRAMRAFGWRARNDFRNRCVCFTRDVEDEQR